MTVTSPLTRLLKVGAVAAMAGGLATGVYFSMQLGAQQDASPVHALAAEAGGLSPPADITPGPTPTPRPTPKPTQPPSVTITTVDSAGKVGTYNAIAVGADGLPVISYIESTNGDLRVAHCGNVACSAGNTITTVAKSVLASYPSIAVGADGLPVITYTDYDYSDGGGLSVAHCGNPSCSGGNTITIVDGAAKVGGYPNIAVGTDGLPVISYVDTADHDLKVAHCGNASCSAGNTITIVDSASRVAYAMIAVGADGLPVISYNDSANIFVGLLSLKVAHCGNLACSAGNTLTTVDSAHLNEPSIAVGADGLPVISYTDAGDVKVAHCGNASCSAGNTLTMVDSVSNVYYTSMGVGTDGLPVITYADYADLADRHLKVAHCGNASCSAGNVVTILDSPGGAMAPSIAVGADGLPVVSYGGGGLTVAHCNTATCAEVTDNKDSDHDGCSDAQEAGPNPALGGMRDPANFWDFFDTPDASNYRDRRVNIVDIGAIVPRFGSAGDPNGDPLDAPQALTGYHVSADRSPPVGHNLWNAGPPDGDINIIEIGLAVAQFGHSCN